MIANPPTRPPVEAARAPEPAPPPPAPLPAETVPLSPPIPGPAPAQSPARAATQPLSPLPAEVIHQRNMSGLGVVLLVVGALLFFGQFGLPDLLGQSTVLIIGAILLFFYFGQHQSVGYLIPGAILTGLGAGILADAILPNELGSGSYAALGLGLGFCAIWVFAHDHWWSLIPGGIIALSALGDMWDHTIFSSWWPTWHVSIWPFLMLLAGAWLILSRNQAPRQR